VKTSSIKTLAFTVLMSIAVVMPSQARLYAVRDFALDTPIGRLGYAEMRSTMSFGSLETTGYFFLGPLGMHSAREMMTLFFAGALVVALIYSSMLAFRRIQR
jgi:hypothetical protein